MADRTGVSWATSTWPLVKGCDEASEGCVNCYAAFGAYIHASHPNGKVAAQYEGLSERGPDGRVKWTGKVRLLPDNLSMPLRWRKPRRVFVCSEADLFHPRVPDEFIAEAFAVMAACPQHTFQVLTKRHARMRALLSSLDFDLAVAAAWSRLGTDVGSMSPGHTPPYPLPNVHLGVSVENQKWADIRIPALLATPAAVRWVSAEPLLGRVFLAPYMPTSDFNPDPDAECMRCGADWFSNEPGHEVVHRCGRDCTVEDGGDDCDLSGEETGAYCEGPMKPYPCLDWVVLGGESGSRSRPMHPQWARDIRDQCAAADVPFHFKQWGSWMPAPWKLDRLPGESDREYKARSEREAATHAFTGGMHRDEHGDWVPGFMALDHKPWSCERSPKTPSGAQGMRRASARANGRLLDGVLHDAHPTPQSMEVAL